MNNDQNDDIEDCGHAFRDDLKMVSDRLANEDSMIVSYALYVGLQSIETGEVTHLSSYASNETDSLVGRLEMIKSIIVNRYNNDVATPTVEDVKELNKAKTELVDINKYIHELTKGKPN